MAPAHYPGAGPVRRFRHWRGLLLSVATLCCLLLFLLFSETALRGSVALLTKILEPLSVEEVHGRLAGPLTLGGIQYADMQNQLTLERLTLDWAPTRLFFLTAHVKYLHASGLHFRQRQKPPQSSEPPTEFTLPQIGFPLKIIIEEASLDGMEIFRLDQAKPLAVTQITLQAETSLNTLEVQALRLESDWLTLVVRGNLRPRQSYQTALELEWSVPQPDNKPWQGNGTLRGDIERLELQQRLISPFAATLQLAAEDLLDALQWNGRIDIPQLHSSQLPYPVSPAFTLGGTVSAKGNLDTFTATTQIAGEVETVGNIELKADAVYGDRQIRLTQLQLIRPGEPARLEASGEVDLTTPLRYRLQANWEALSWPLENPSVVSESGTLAASGEDKSYLFNSDLLLGGTQIPPGHWQLQGSGDEQAVQLTALEGKLLDGSVSGTANLELVPQLRWQAQLQGKELNPGVKWHQWPGMLAFTADLQGRQEKEGLAMTISLPALSGTLRERKLEGHSEAEISNQALSVKELALRVGSASLAAKGQLSDKLAFDWQLQADNMADVLPQTTGTLKAKGNLTGPLKTPKLELQIETQQLGYGAYQSEKIHAEIALDLQGRRSSSLDLKVDQLQLPGFPQESITLKGRGSLAKHDITLDVSNSSQHLTLGLSASYTEGRWAGMLNQLRIDDSQLGLWLLEKPANFAMTSQMLNLQEFCLNRETASLCTQAGWEGNNRFSTSLRSVRFPLNLLQPHLPERFKISGELDGQASLELLAQDRTRLEVDLTIGPGQFALFNPELDDNDLALSYRGAVIRASTPKGILNGELTLSLTEQDTVALTIQSSLVSGLPKDPLQQPLTARLAASISDLGFVSSLVTEVQNFQGRLEADVQLAGTLKTPRLSGYAQLEEGQLDIPRMGLELSNIRLAASGTESQRMEIRGEARSGGGNLALSGQLAPTDTGAWGLELTLRGTDFEVARIPEARMTISPDLKASIVGREVRLEGAIDIPSARLEPPDISLAVKPSEDVVIVTREEEETMPERWRIYTRIRMTAAETIRFIGYGFDGRVGGDLLLIDEPASLTRARGQLHIVPGSTYSSFGTKLSTEHGQLNFADSPVDNPNLDIKASRKIGDVIAGIYVSGTAKKPLLRLYSEPPMDQADILSYLTLGHPMGTAGQSEGETLAGAANTAGLIGGNYLAGYIGRQFGLEEASVEADPTTQSPWVVLGTYLSPRLYVRYGVGVYEDAYSLLVRYQLTEHWQVQGEGGQNSGADILYTFERP